MPFPARARAESDAARHRYAPPADLDDREEHLAWFRTVRADTEALIAPLAPEDMVVQTMADVSPTKWHLGHTGWFFETFLLAPLVPGHAPPDPAYPHLFNSYYEQIGAPFPRPRRGLLSRPTVREIMDYRVRIDEAMAKLILHLDAARWRKAAPFVTLGLHHEQQHQELILTDIKHVLSHTPLAPALWPRPAMPEPAPEPGGGHNRGWREFAGGTFTIGVDEDEDGFSYDNESRRHDRLVRPFRLARHPVRNGEYMAFMHDRGYERTELWLSDGWDAVRAQGWSAPLYWRRGENGGWREFTLHGDMALDPDAPVCHLSYYEADAYATWAGARLPLEEELEHASHTMADGGMGTRSAGTGNRANGGMGEGVWRAHPLAVSGTDQDDAGVWEWTRDAYAPYPGYRPQRGPVGEYNGKFMCGQYVLRGGSCATPPGHLRPTYRNFFPPGARWQFTGLRLAAAD